MKAYRFFLAMIFLGALVVIATIICLAIPDSPYRYGKIAGNWFIAQLYSGAILIYSGMFGCIICSAARMGHVQKLRMPIVWSVSSILVILFAFCVIMAFFDPKEVILPTFVDYLARSVAQILILPAILSMALMTFYGLWVHKEKRNRAGTS